MNSNDMNEVAKAEQMMVFVSIGMRVLGQRSLEILALALNAGIFSWAMYSDTWPRIVGAAIFGLVTWFLVNYKGAPHES